MNRKQEQALFTMRFRARTDMRALRSTGVTESLMEDLVDQGYAVIVDRRRRAWALTDQGVKWVERHLPDMD